MNIIKFTLFLILNMLLVVSCNKNKADPILDSAITSFSYPQTELILEKNVALDFLSPTITGTNIACSISPALPAGLQLSSSLCHLVGIPSAVSPQKTYIITAKNGVSNVSTAIKITVNEKIVPDISFIQSTYSFTINSVIVPIQPILRNGNFINFTVTNPLPNGLSIDSTTGVISGTPNVLSETSSVIVKGITDKNDIVYGSLLLKINDIPIDSVSYSNNNIILTKNQIVASNILPITSGGTPLMYSVTPALPAGLILNDLTGQITGTPSGIKERLPYIITASNSAGETSTSINIEIKDIPPGNLSYGTSGVVLTKTNHLNEIKPTANGGTILSYSIDPILPVGLTFNTQNGAIAGTPTIVSGLTSYTITAINSGGSTSTVFTILVKDLPPQNLTYPISNAFFIKNTPATQISPSVGGGAVVNYTISPLLPTGLIFDSQTGQISGTPQVISNTTSYTVTAINSEGSTTYSFYLSVKDEAPQNLNYASTELVLEKGLMMSNLSPTNDNGAIKNYTVSPTLPTGLILENTTGLLTGTPTIIAERTKYTITGSNATGQTTRDIYITVNDKIPLNFAYPETSYTFSRGEPISNKIPGNTGGTILIYSISPALPTGLSLDSQTGIISGAPLGFQNQTTYTIYGTNSGGTATTSLDITINDYPPSGLFYGTGVRQLTRTVNLGDGIVPIYTGGAIVYFTINPALPTGLSFNTTTGAIYGIPTIIDSTPKTFTIVGYNSGGSTTASIQLKTVDIAPTITMNQTSYLFTQSSGSVTIGSNILVPIVTGGTSTLFSLVSELSDPLFSGLSFNSTTGVISGVTTQLGRKTFFIKAQNDGGFTTTQFVVEIVEQPPGSITYSPSSYLFNRDLIPEGQPTSYVPISVPAPSHTGGIASSYSITPALPIGLTFNAATGAITGIPKEGGQYVTYTVIGTNSGGSASTTFQMKIRDIPPSSLVYSVNSAAYPSLDSWVLPAPTNAGGEITTYSISPALPSGIVLNSDGSIERDNSIPMPKILATTYTITGSNAEGSTTATVSIEIFDSEPTDLSYPNGQTVGKIAETMYFNIGQTKSYTPTQAGGLISLYTMDSIESIAKGPTYSVDNTDQIFTPISMPAGFSMNTATGVLTGTPGLTPSLYKFALTISGSNGAGSTPTSLLIIINRPPVSNAGSDITSTIGQTITLNGSTSSDPDFDVDTILNADMTQNDIGDRVAVYKWSIVSKPSGSIADINNFTNKDSAMPSFIPDKIGTYVFNLVANDYLLDAPSDTITVVINDVAPANLTYGSSAFGSNIFAIQKNNFATYSPANTGGTIVSYSVSPVLPVGMTLNPTTGVISGTPTTALSPTNYTITATNTGGSTSVVVKLWVNEVPTASISAVNKHPMPGLLTLNGSITDSDSAIPLSSPYNATGTSISYTWSIISKPGTSTALLSNVNAQNPTIIPDKKGTYIFQLIVNDGFVSSTVVTKTITSAIPPSGLTYGTQSPFIANTFAYTNGLDSVNRTISVTGDLPITYSISGLLPSGLSINTTTGAITGNPISVQAPSDYVITATNDGGSSTVSVKFWINDYPVANAGSAQTGKNIGSSVTLSGALTSDSDNAITNSAPYNAVTKLYTWDVVGIPPTSAITNASISNRNTVSANFTPDVEGDYYFRLKYFDGLVTNLNESIVKITTTNAAASNKILYPIAHAGTTEYFDGFYCPGCIINLNAAKSLKYTGTLSYLWSVVSVPSGASTTITNPTSVTASLPMEHQGVYNLKLTVSDGTNSSIDYITAYSSNVANDVLGGTLSGNQTLIKGYYELTNDLIIDSGNTLTIDPGVVIDGFGYNIYVKNGSLIANGGATISANTMPIIFKNTKINVQAPGTTTIQLQHVVMEGGELCAVKGGTQACKGSFSAKWSVFKNLTGDSQIGNTTTAAVLDGNSFFNSSGFYVSSIGQSFDVKNNCVYKAKGGHVGLGNYFVKVIADSTSSINIAYNYLMNDDSRILLQSSNLGGNISSAKTNFWNLFSPNAISTFVTNPAYFSLEPFASRFDFSNDNDCRKYTIP